MNNGSLDVLAGQELSEFYPPGRDLLCTANFDGYLTSVSQGWQHEVGWTPGQLTGRPYLEFIHPEDRSAMSAKVAELQAGEPNAMVENRFSCCRLCRCRHNVHYADLLIMPTGLGLAA